MLNASSAPAGRRRSEVCWLYGGSAGASSRLTKPRVDHRTGWINRPHTSISRIIDEIIFLEPNKPDFLPPSALRFLPFDAPPSSFLYPLTGYACGTKSTRGSAMNYVKDFRS
jgi:hypothetical protein